MASPRPARSLPLAVPRPNSAQNVTSAHNYGIVKAGDGGNGGRGKDGTGGSDTADNSAPTTGTYGFKQALKNSSGQEIKVNNKLVYIGGAAGAGGIAYLYDTTETGKNPETGENPNNGSAGQAGSRGNDGWGGLNLYKYVTKDTHTGVEVTTRRIAEYHVAFKGYVDDTISASDTNGEPYTRDMYSHAGVEGSKISILTSKIIVSPVGRYQPDGGNYDYAVYNESNVYLRVEADINVYYLVFHFDNKNLGTVIWTGSIRVRVNSGNMFANNLEFNRYCNTEITSSNCSWIEFANTGEVNYKNS